MAATPTQPLQPKPRSPSVADRRVFCLLGAPLDIVDMAGLEASVREAASRRQPFLLSTPNVNFLALGRRSPALRRSLVESDLCVADGMPLVWMARLLGVPLRERVAGSDLFERLTGPAPGTEPLRVFFFGGDDGAAERAAADLAGRGDGAVAAGWLNPGRGDVAELSQDEIFVAMNRSGADMLVVALGAEKGQAWLLANRHRIDIPVRSHLGAVVNFVAGTVRRAPAPLRKAGLEWAWRIREEPHLWRRYAGDALSLARPLLTQVLPYALWLRLRRRRRARTGFRFDFETKPDRLTCRLEGHASGSGFVAVLRRAEEALDEGRRIVFDLAGLEGADPEVFGSLLLLDREAERHGASLHLEGLTPTLLRLFRWNGLAGWANARRQDR